MVFLFQLEEVTSGSPRNSRRMKPNCMAMWNQYQRIWAQLKNRTWTQGQKVQIYSLIMSLKKHSEILRNISFIIFRRHLNNFLSLVLVFWNHLNRRSRFGAVVSRSILTVHLTSSSCALKATAFTTNWIKVELLGNISKTPISWSNFETSIFKKPISSQRPPRD